MAKHFGGGKRLVVTAAGAGREVVALLDLGHDAVGYEPHPRLVAFGAELLARRGHPNRLRPAPRDAFPPDAEACDGVVVGWGSYTLIPGRRARVAFLRAARERLSEGAPLLVSFFVRREERRYLQLLSATANVVRRARGKEPVELATRSTRTICTTSRARSSRPSSPTEAFGWSNSTPRRTGTASRSRPESGASRAEVLSPRPVYQLMTTPATPTPKPLDVRLMGTTMRLPSHVVFRSFPAETILLDLESGTYHGLNHTGGRMLEGLERLGEVRKVAEELANEFQQPIARIQTDLCQFCQDLLDRGLLEQVSKR